MVGWIKKPQNYWLVFFFMIVITLLVLVIYFFHSNLELLSSYVSLVTVALFAIILTAIQIKQFLNKHFAQNKLDLGGVGKRNNIYYAQIKNKKDEVALNCRGNIVIADHNADSVWADPSHPREIDIPLTEDLDLFEETVTDLIFPLGSIDQTQEVFKRMFLMQSQRPLLDLKSITSKYIHQKIKKYEKIKDKLIKITITSRNANQYIFTLTNPHSVISAFKNKKFLTKQELKELNLLCEYKNKNSSKTPSKKKREIIMSV